jgi:hypothetical protein
MSNASADNHELKDVELCYTALGLSIGDSPAKIEMTYKRLVETYKANLASPDPAARADAQNSLKLIEEMYDKIKNSVTYQTMYRDQERRNKMHGEAEKSRMQQSEAGALDKSLTKCPTCRTVINKGLKTCPRCKARIVSPFEKLMEKIFTPTNVIVFGCIVVIGTLAFIGFTFPEQVKEILGLFRK